MTDATRWSDGEVALLERLWLRDMVGKHEIARQLGRSYEGVKNKIFQLRLLRGSKSGPTPWSRDEEAELRRLWGRGDRIAEIAERIAVSPSAVRAKVRRMGLPERLPGKAIRRRPVESASPWFGAKPQLLPEPVRPGRKPAIPEPTSRDIPFIDLPPAACKWIPGDGAPWLACGHPTGAPQRPWCPYHSELARWQDDTAEACDTGLAA